ncbi:MAG: hypothetical protein ACAH65_11350, partial [Chloroflexota bacterium]
MAASQPIAAPGGGFARPPVASLRGRITASPWTYRLIVLAVVATIWQLYAIRAHSLLIPTFTSTVFGVADLLRDPDVYRAFYLSNQALVLGFAISL